MIPITEEPKRKIKCCSCGRALAGRALETVQKDPVFFRDGALCDSCACAAPLEIDTSDEQIHSYDW